MSGRTTSGVLAVVLGGLVLVAVGLWIAPRWSPYGQFIRAINAGNAQGVALILSQHPEFVNRRLNGTTPLHYAARVPNGTRVIRLLIDRGAAVNAGDSAGETPLFWAVRGRHAQNVGVLLASGAKPGVYNNRGLTPLHYGTSAEIAEALLKSGADVSALSKDGNKFTPLHTAARFGQMDVARILVGAGANVNAASARGTPEAMAKRYMHSDVEAFLRSQGRRSAGPEPRTD